MNLQLWPRVMLSFREETPNNYFTILRGLCGEEMFWHGDNLHPACTLSIGYKPLPFCIECMTQAYEEMYER